MMMRTSHTQGVKSGHHSSLASLNLTRRCSSRRATTSLQSASSDYNSAPTSSSFGGETTSGQQQQAPMQPQAASLIRRPSLAPAVIPTQPVVVSMSQVVGKQVITRSSGRNLGLVNSMWVDASRGEVVSMDVEEKKGAVAAVASVGGGGGGGGAGLGGISNVQLARLVQIGDVLLVQDEQVLYDPPLDGRYGFLVIAGMEVRTRGGDFLGKVRDFSFNPDSGAISRLVYDDFGLAFLPSAFFDTFSVALGDVLGIGPGGIVVADDAKYRERRESNGLFAALPSLLRSIGGGGGGGGGGGSVGGIAGLLSAGSSQDAFLPQGYTYAQWEMDVRRWEQETGLSYDQYIRSSSSSSPTSPPQQQQIMLGGGGGRGAPSPSSWSPQPQPRYSSPYPAEGGGLPPMERPQQLQPRPSPPQQQQQQQRPPLPQQQQGGYPSKPPSSFNPSSSSSSSPSSPGQMRRGGGPSTPQQPSQPQQWQPSMGGGVGGGGGGGGGGGRGGGPQSVDPRYRGPASAPYYPSPSPNGAGQVPQPSRQPRQQQQGQPEQQQQQQQQGQGRRAPPGANSAWSSDGSSPATQPHEESAPQ